MGTPYIGEIRMAGFSFAPLDWLPCDGRTVSISDYPELYNLIGTTYGGDGQSTFGLPDLRSRVAIHQGTDNVGINYSLGNSGGSEKVTLNASTLGSHTHPFTAFGTPGDSNSPFGDAPAGSTLNLYVNDPNNQTSAFAGNAISLTGPGGAHNNIMPYQCINFVIAMSGIYPTQS